MELHIILRELLLYLLNTEKISFFLILHSLKKKKGKRKLHFVFYIMSREREIYILYNLIQVDHYSH